jgi:hypothetical protein
LLKTSKKQALSNGEKPMRYQERQLQRWAAYASILSFPIGVLGLVFSVLGVRISYIGPPSPPRIDDHPPVDLGELGHFTDEYMSVKRFWGDDAISNLFANFFSRPSLWIPVSLALLLFFAVTRLRSKRSIEKMKQGG